MTKERKRIKVTYSTLGSPDPLLHEYFEADVAELKNSLGQRYRMLINGEWVEGEATFEHRSPINTDWLLGVFARVRQPSRSSGGGGGGGFSRLA